MLYDLIPFTDLVKDISGGNLKLKGKEYLETGKIPIVDQGKELVSGFTNNEKARFKGDLPVIIFGDHTRVFKYIDFDFVLGADGVKVLKVSEKLFPKFCYYYLKGSIIPNLGYNRHYKILKELRIPLPPLSIQQQIARILDQADALQKKTQQVIDLYDQLAQSIFLDMFGDTYSNPKKWKTFFIEDVSSKEKHSIKAGPFGSSLKKEFYVEEGYKIYGQEQVIRDDLFYGDYYIDEYKYNELKSCKVQAGDILISLVGTYGKVSIVPDSFKPGIINPRLMKITPNVNLIRSDFLKKLLQSDGISMKIRDQSRGGTMDIINVGIIKKLIIPVPPLTLQNQFAEKISLIEKQKELAKQSLQESENLFNALLQKAFKGELVNSV
jgi:type I restriction enzyme, S subunit